MYHWCHLELKKYFGYEGALNGETAEEVWNLCNEKLKEPGMSVRGLIAQSNVAFVGTTDDPVDSLEWHQKIKEDPSITTAVSYTHLSLLLYRGIPRILYFMKAPPRISHNPGGKAKETSE